MKLELKHLAAYLPYDLICMANANAYGVKSLFKKMNCYLMINLINNDTIYKPILRPLSDLTKEITVNGQTFVPIEWLEEKYYTLDLHEQAKRLIEELDWLNQTEYMLVDYLHEWHFDTFGLIEAGLAVDINTI